MKYHEDTQRLLNRAERMGRKLAMEYDGHLDNLNAWVESAIKAEINIIARNDETVKQAMDKVEEPYSE